MRVIAAASRLSRVPPTPRAEPPSRVRLLGRGCRGGDAGAADDGRRALRRMHDVRAGEVAAAEDAVAATLGMLPALMSAFAEVAKEKNSPSPLESGPAARFSWRAPGTFPARGGRGVLRGVSFDAVFRPLALPALAALAPPRRSTSGLRSPVARSRVGRPVGV